MTSTDMNSNGHAAVDQLTPACKSGPDDEEPVLELGDKEPVSGPGDKQPVPGPGEKQSAPGPCDREPVPWLCDKNPVPGPGDEEDRRPVKSGVRDGWWWEWIDISMGGQAFCIKVADLLYHEQSPYQDILIFKSETYGTVLALDGIVNCTERDECSYQEMMTHLALCSHPHPKAMVVESCKKFLPSMAVGFAHPKVHLHIGDGFEFMRNHVNEFDVIITDSSDPIGPAEALFRKEYYELLFTALRAGGIVSSQGESMWVKMAADYIPLLVKDMKDIFPVVRYAYTYTPSYTTGQIGILLASKNKDTCFERPLRVLSEEDKLAMSLRYYNEDIHCASFKLPQFIKKVKNVLLVVDSNGFLKVLSLS